MTVGSGAGGREDSGEPADTAGVDRELEDALWEAFGTESQDRQRYAVFAQRAAAQGFPQLAHLFRAVSIGEELHAQRHLKAARGVAGVAENLRQAVAAEEAAVAGRYPLYLERARAARNRRAERAFEYARGSDLAHLSELREAVRGVEAGRDLAPAEYLVCKVCGYLQVGAPPPDFCPVCGSPAEVFFGVD